MGLFNKLKNVLFEEEEIEVPVEEPKKEVVKEVVKEEPVKKSVPLEEDIPALNTEEFHSENSFDFPVFDEEEFAEVKKEQKMQNDTTPSRGMGINLFDYERPKIKKDNDVKIKAPEIKGRAYEAKNTTLSKHKFQPSPVISPVYGVLDKNYKKEDIVLAKDEKKAVDVDDVRKKAFGTLEEDIEKKMNPPKRSSVPKEKTIDELLEASSYDEIDLQDDEKLDVPMNLEQLDQREKKHAKTVEEVEETKENNENDTFENDLFDLIDSMYENKEDE